MCCCHTLCHVGKRFELTVLNEFMTPWLDLVGGRNPHAGAKALWRETVAPARVPGYSNVRWYAKAEIIFVIGEAGTRRLRDFLVELEARDYGEATRQKLLQIYNTNGETLRLQIAAMLDMRVLVQYTYQLEGDQLEILLVFDRLEALRALGRSVTAQADGVLPNVDAVLRFLMPLKKGVKVEKYFQGHGIATGTLDKVETVHSTLHADTEVEAWTVKYTDGHTEDFEVEELRSGKDGPAPTHGDGKPVLAVRGMAERSAICDALAPGFKYLEDRLTGECDSQYSCVAMYHVCSLVRVFDLNYAAAHATTALVDQLDAITPLASHGLLNGMKTQLPAYLAAAVAAPAFDKTDVEGYTTSILAWWRVNGNSFDTWALAARMVFSFSPNSAICERVFSLRKTMFGDQQMSALADFLSAALKLKFNHRSVG